MSLLFGQLNAVVAHPGGGGVVILLVFSCNRKWVKLLVCGTLPCLIDY